MNKKVERPICKECGDEGFYRFDGDILCENCDLLFGYDMDYGGTFDTKEEAAKAWNRRSDNGTL